MIRVIFSFDKKEKNMKNTVCIILLISLVLLLCGCHKSDIYESSYICDYLSKYCKQNQVIFLVSSQYIKSDFSCFSLENDSSLDYQVISCKDKILYYNFGERKNGMYQVYSVDYYGDSKEFCFETPYHIVGTYEDFYLVYENSEYSLLYGNSLLPAEEPYVSYISSKRIENENIYITVLGNSNEFVINRELLINKSNIGDFLKQYDFKFNVLKSEENIIFIECTIKNTFYDKTLLLFEYNLNEDSIIFIDCCAYGMDGVQYYYLK
jgi:hypothetical protein